MITDPTGIVLLPGKGGMDCLGNGEKFDTHNVLIECCCDECPYMLCCLPSHNSELCKTCRDTDCPRAGKNNIP